MTINKAQGQSLQVCQLNLEIYDLHTDNYMFACLQVGNLTKLFIFAQDCKTKKKKNRVCHSTSINNYLQNTQQNIYFFEWHGNACQALASFIIIRT